MSPCVRRVVWNLSVIAIFLAIVDGFVYRDPYVELPHGYAIAAISSSSPCELLYTRWKNEQAISGVAKRSNVTDDPKAPAAFGAILSDVSRYRVKNDQVIGSYRDGFFLLDTASHSLETWQSASEWKKNVPVQFGPIAFSLRNPKSRWQRTRHSLTLPIYLGFVIVALLISWRECRRKVHPSAN